METYLALWLVLAFVLWYLVRRPPAALHALLAAAVVFGWSAVALADTAAGAAGASSDPLGDLQKMLTVALTGAMVGAIGALGKRAWDWLGHSSAGKAAESVLHDSKLDAWFADHAISFAEEQSRKALKAGAKALDGTAKMKAARAFLSDHGYAGEALEVALSMVEARIGAQRAMGQLARGAKNIEDAMTTGQLGKDIATLERQQAEAEARMKQPPKLPPPPLVAVTGEVTKP